MSAGAQQAFPVCEKRQLARGTGSAPGLNEHQMMELSHLLPGSVQLSLNLVSGDLGKASFFSCEASHSKPLSMVSPRGPTTTGLQNTW